MMNPRSTNLRSRPARLASLVALAAIALLLSACESLPGVGSQPSQARAERLASNGQHERAAEQYMALAGQAIEQQRDRFLLLAALQWIEAGDETRARTAIDAIDPPAAQPLANDWRIARATLAVLAGDGTAALAELDVSEPERYSLNQRIAAQGVRGDALFLTDDPLAAVRTLQQRELWLNAGDEIERNHQRIWDGLLQTSPQALAAALAETTDATLAGWLALGALADGSVAGGPARGLSGWQRQYPDHPALRFIVPGFEQGERGPGSGAPRTIALLLPLSGRTAAAGEAVRDGFLARYASRYRGQIDTPTVLVFDTADSGAVNAYQQALDAGADFVVGPILRRSIEEILASDQPLVPTLFLNYLSADAPLPAGVYQFGLAPEDEAAAIARLAYSEGFRRAVSLAPISDWGDRVAAAFYEEFQSLGGEVVASQDYIAEEADYSKDIEAVLLLNDSAARYRALRSVIGGPLQHEPRRRQDVDFVFIAASNDSARRFRPQLQFHYAGDLPIFATAAVYAPNDKRSDSDLRGIRFADIPWLLAPSDGDALSAAVLQPYFSGARAQPRLFALGLDALEVVVGMIHVDEEASLASPQRDGVTGTLTLDFDGRVRRSPAFGQFTADGIVPVAAPVEATAPQDIALPAPDDNLTRF